MWILSWVLQALLQEVFIIRTHIFSSIVHGNGATQGHSRMTMCVLVQVHPQGVKTVNVGQVLKTQLDEGDSGLAFFIHKC